MEQISRQHNTVFAEGLLLITLRHSYNGKEHQERVIKLCTGKEAVIFKKITIAISIVIESFTSQDPT